MPRWSNFAIFIAKLRISERNAKEKRIFLLLLFRTKGLENLLSLASARNSVKPNLQKKILHTNENRIFYIAFPFLCPIIVSYKVAAGALILSCRSIAFELQEHCFYYVGTRRAAFFPHFVLKAAARHPKGWRFQSEAGKESRATGEEMLIPVTRHAASLHVEA